MSTPKFKKPTYDDLLRENAVLRSEIDKLKQKFGMTSNTTSANLSVSSAANTDSILMDIQSHPHIHKHSSPDEKIELFMELFIS